MIKHGDILFKTPEQDMLRLCGDGRILVKNKEVTVDSELVKALWAWVGASITTGAGNVTVISGQGLESNTPDTGAGGNVTLVNPNPCSCPNLLNGHHRKCQYSIP